MLMDITSSMQTMLLAILSGFAATWAMRQIARHFNIVNHPNPIVPQHKAAVAYLGGVGVALGAVGAVLIKILVSSGIHLVCLQSMSVLTGAIFFLILGVADDLRAFKPLTKFLLQGAVAIGTVLIGLLLPLTGVSIIDGAITVLWVLTLVNAVNFTDVCDGLVGGLSTVAFFSLAVLDPNSSDAWLAIAGAICGFLVWNAPPASIFLGDAGSHLLGFLLAVGTIEIVKNHTLWPGGCSAMLIVGIPLFELFFITVMRIRKGLPWWRGSPDHFSLRLQAKGLSKWRTNLIAWSIGGIMTVSALSMSYMKMPMQLAVVSIIFIMLAICWMILSKLEVKK
ncbi:MAG: glycosyltransferase family 4 protein [Candidatus Electronema sp. V4]|uniref:glycosyltransferase family 4 protein n=1 Tax=Candidatus Electronema sp. V4 TaxID=3454756 RepID=UPI0040554DD3